MSGDVRTQDALTWLAACLGYADRSPTGQSDKAVVVGTSLSERERWTPLIRQAVEQEDGALIDATTVGESGVFCGDICADAPALVAKVEGYLNSYNFRTAGADLELQIEDQWARVVGAEPFASANAAQRAIREIATAVCADELRATYLTAIVYAEDALDAANAASIWKFLMEGRDLFDLADGSVFLVVAGDGRIDFDLHCSGPSSLRYRLTADGMSSRKSWEQSAAPFRDLAACTRADMPLFVMFLGAGASVMAGLRTGDSLRNDALSGLSGEPVDAGNWREVAGRWFDHLRAVGELSPQELAAGVEQFVERLTLERVVQVEQAHSGTTFSRTLRQFGEAHQVVRDRLVGERTAGLLVDDPLVNLLALQKRIVLVTVNFDQVIEAKAGDAVKVFHDEASFAELGTYLDNYADRGGAVPLVKLHGDIGDPESLVANLSQTRAGLSVARSAALDEIIQRVSAQNERHWWYVGYSMRDADLLNAWAGPHFVDGVAERWVAPFLDPSVELFIAENRSYRWSLSGVRSGYSAPERAITLTASDAYRLLYSTVLPHWT